MGFKPEDGKGWTLSRLTARGEIREGVCNLRRLKAKWDVSQAGYGREILGDTSTMS
jgi:hypothetical protein